MKYESINRRYTEVVAEWMAKGYTINTATMSGSQGEVAKIDLTNGQEIIRILLEPTGRPITRIGERCYNFDSLHLAVCRAQDQIPANSGSTWATIWRNRLDTIYSEDYYQIGREHRNGEKWYGTRDEAIAQQDKQWERYCATASNRDHDLPEEAKRIVLPFLRRQPKCKSVQLSDVESVTKRSFERRDGTCYSKYIVTARGKTYTLQ